MKGFRKQFPWMNPHQVNPFLQQQTPSLSFLCYAKGRAFHFEELWELLQSLVCSASVFDSYLKHGQAKRMAQIISRRDQNFSVAAIDINAGQWMQFGVYPVETLIQQIWSETQWSKITHSSCNSLSLAQHLFPAGSMTNLFIIGLFFF